MAGLYETLFGTSPVGSLGMTEAQTNGHWKHEQDNYLSNIGAMALIKRDPKAFLGYQIRSDNPNRTLDMGSGVDPAVDQMYGLYKFTPEGGNFTGPRTDGSLDVSVNQPVMDYGATVAHELGHVGSRNSQTDTQITSNSQEEERRQRITDLANNGLMTRAGQDAAYLLKHYYGMSPKQIDKEVAQRRKELGLKADPSTEVLRVSKAPLTKKKQDKPVYDHGTKQWIDPTYANAPSWTPQAGED